jgi:shikimate dehydrogenase
MDTLSPTAARAGSVNTVLFSNGRAEGTSTDGQGFMAALRNGGRSGSDELPSRALILGTGGAARAVACALLMKGTKVTVCSRNAETGGHMASDLGVRFVSPERDVVAREVARADLLVNATPVGGAADPGACPLPRSVSLRPGLVVFDLVYRPRRTALLAMAEAAGCRTVEGIEMLVEQAARSFETWTGRPAPTQVMRVAGYRALEDPPDPGRLVGRSDLPSSITKEAR